MKFNPLDAMIWFRALAGSVSLLVMLVLASAAGADERVSPITLEPTGESHPGKVIWMDLVTHDVRRASDFYRQVFGWAIRLNEDGGYAEAFQRGRPVAAFVRYEDDAPEDAAQWLVSISVPDVDAAAAAARKQGGAVLEGPERLKDRGRWALISDSQGALLMLLKASGGDPPDEAPAANEWLWAELWTDDPAAAVGFYESVVGYKSVEARESDGGEVRILGRDGVARATVVKSPWEEVKPNWLAYVVVDDLAATLDAVESNGGEVLVQPAVSADGDVAIVADPTGGVFALQNREGQL
jgi:predicted enzyme related to lactoylglutathione lyase